MWSIDPIKTFFLRVHFCVRKTSSKQSEHWNSCSKNRIWVSMFSFFKLDFIVRMEEKGKKYISFHIANHIKFLVRIKTCWVICWWMDSTVFWSKLLSVSDIEILKGFCTLVYIPPWEKKKTFFLLFLCLSLF